MARATLLALLLAGGFALSACQSSEARKEQLASICASPINRAPQSSYYQECQSLYPLSDRQLQQNYRLGAPAQR